MPDGVSEDEGFTLSSDGLRAYFASTRPGGPSQGLTYDLWVTRRASAADSFDVAQPLPGSVNTRAKERQPSISPDNLFIYYTDERDIWVSGRGTENVPFGVGDTVLGDVNTPEHQETEPFIAGDGKSLYFVSDREGFQRRDLFVSVRQPDGRFSGTRPVLLTGAITGSPVLTPDQLTLYYQNSYGTWRAHRRSLSDAFESNEVLALRPNVDLLKYSWPEAVSSDDCVLFIVQKQLPDDPYAIYQISRAK